MTRVLTALVLMMNLLPLPVMAQSGTQWYQGPNEAILQGMEMGRRFDKAAAGDYSPNPPYQPYYQQPQPTQPQIDLNRKFQELRLQQFLDQQQMDRLNRESHQPPYNRR